MSAAGNTDTSNNTDNTNNTTTTTTVTKAWFDGADAETIGRIQNRGWDKMAANEAAMAAVKAHHEAEKHLGVPANQLLRLPKDASDEAGRKAMLERLGVPADVKGYDFKDIKFTDGTELDDAFKDTMSKAFLDNGVPKDAAPGIVKQVVKFMEDQDKAEATANAAKMAEEADALAKSWGTNLKSNTFIANQAAEKLGFGKDLLDKMVGVVGRTEMAQALLKMGQMMGEDRFIKVPDGQPQGVMTREGALARMAELMNDKQFGQRLFNGDSRAKQEFDALNRMLV